MHQYPRNPTFDSVSERRVNALTRFGFTQREQMNRHIGAVVIATTLSLLVYPDPKLLAGEGGGGSQDQPAPQQAPTLSEAPKELPALRGSLRALIPGGTPPGAVRAIESPLVEGGRIPVTIRTTGTTEVLDALRAMSRLPANTMPGVIEVYLSESEILHLAAHGSVVSLEIIQPPEPRVVSQGR
jgi:hypothetical protein